MITNKNQFNIDVPRLHIYIDNIRFKDNPDILWRLINNIFSEYESNIITYFLTQTSLSKYYIDEVYSTCKDNEHIVNSNGYNIYINTINKSIYISKNFDKIYLDNNILFNIDFIELNIHCDITNNIIMYNWCYDFDDIDVVVIDNLQNL